MRQDILDGFNGHVDLVVPLLAGSKEHLHIERFVCVELLLHWLETQLLLVFLGHINAIGHLGLGQILNHESLLGAYSRESRGEIYFSLILQLQLRLCTNTRQGKFSSSPRQVIQRYVQRRFIRFIVTRVELQRHYCESFGLDEADFGTCPEDTVGVRAYLEEHRSVRLIYQLYAVVH